jgi:hypothetical protein
MILSNMMSVNLVMITTVIAPHPLVRGYRVYTSQITPLNPPDALGGNRKSSSLLFASLGAVASNRCLPRGNRKSSSLPFASDALSLSKGGGLGWGDAHWCQLNVKASREQAFRYCLGCLVPSLRLGMFVVEAPPQDLRQSRNDRHFQPEAGNEV